MSEINQHIYNVSLEVLTSAGIPEPLADAASRIVATDDPTIPGLGRNESDVDVCKKVAEIYTKIVERGL